MKRNLDRIISESLNQYLKEALIPEDGNKKKKKRKFRKNAIKLKGGLRTDFDVEDDEEYNKEADDTEQDAVVTILKSKYINVSAVAQDVYPHLTPNGAQSEFNKKLNNDVSDSGYIYRFKIKEIAKIKQVLNQLFSAIKSLK